MDFIEFKALSELAYDFKERLNSLTKNEKQITGISSGFDKLDVITKGFHPSNLILIGGVKGIGKTEFAVSLIRKITIENQCPTAFFCLEMTNQQFMVRMIKQQTNISNEKLQLDMLNENEMELVSKKIEELKQSPLYIADYPFRTISEIEEALECNPTNFAEIIMIDSLQLIAKNKNDKVGTVLNKKELAKITYRLKELATKFNIAILVFFETQENYRKHYKRRPCLSEVRRQAPIDTFADLILLLYRPEYYKIDEWDDDEGLPTAGEAEIIVAKNNLGSIGSARIKFEGNKGFFDNLC